MDRVERGGLKIDPVIDVFVREELTQDTQLSADEFWDCFGVVWGSLGNRLGVVRGLFGGSFG